MEVGRKAGKENLGLDLIGPISRRGPAALRRKHAYAKSSLL